MNTPDTPLVVQPVVLCGGSGTRLWPLSRLHCPKQLLPLLGEDSLLQATLRRCDGLTRVDAGITVNPALVVCNEEHRFQVAEQRRAMGREGPVILESIGRNTAPALTLAAHAARQAGADPVLLVMPADHVIAESLRFQTAVLEGVRLALLGAVVTFGVSPTIAETGYGYIEWGEPTKLFGADTARCIRSFVEKPDCATAQAYVEGGRHLWNCGIFVVRASVWLDTLARCRPDISQACGAAWSHVQADAPFLRAGADAFISCPTASIDVAVMERIAVAPGTSQTGNGDGPPALVIPLPVSWSDVGAWQSMWAELPKDASGNVLQGDVLVHDVKDTLAFSGRRLVACVGVSDLIVVETADAVLVVHKDRSQEVRRIVEQLQEAGRREGLEHRKVVRPWGWYDSVDSGARFQVKRIQVKPGGALSLQMHHHRAEHWIVVKGTARVTRGDTVFLLSENESTFIPLGVRHRLENPGRQNLEIIEVQSGSYLGEDDIVRFGDVYGRV